ncbi:MAG TPA: ABC transporter ATP-binding protein, partial [Candidatus Cloacimonas sp.]|nr:ABC transporter ATP-binding protein [Candidatus Cloacimonas sp.]
MIELKNVTCGYGDFPVLKDISLQIAEGDFCALLGPNGAGKSTLLYTIMGYLKPSEGYITIFEKDIAKIKHSWLAKQIAFVPQETRSEFDHTVQETVLMGRYPYLGFLQSYSSEDYEAVDAVLENLKLTEFKHRWLSEISGGEKQRVLIARALVQQTPFILLDESLSQLDINYQIEIMKLLRTIHSKENKTVLIVSHNINLASNYAERLIFLKEGKLLAAGKPEDLMQKETLKDL